MTAEAAKLRDVLTEAQRERLIVCVDMLGEGFDLPALKVAPHKSLAVTLQFVGRFARSGHGLGDASVFVPRVAGDIDDRLLRLSGEDSDWNGITRDLTEAEVAQKQRPRSASTGGGSDLPGTSAICPERTVLNQAGNSQEFTAGKFDQDLTTASYPQEQPFASTKKRVRFAGPFGWS